MFGHLPLVVHPCVSERSHMLPYRSAHDEWLTTKPPQVSQVQYCQQCVNFLYVGNNPANNVSNFGGDPVTQLIVTKRLSNDQIIV